MTRRKTLLTPEAQWEKTADYLIYLCRNRWMSDYWGQVPTEETRLCIFHGTHPLVMDEDVLIVTGSNGMGKRYGMTGVTSKGARLNDYYLPLRRGYEFAELPDDLSGKQWDDPALLRYVADLRASRRSRVSAYSPALSHCKTLPGIDTNEITCFGLYKSGRTSRLTRTIYETRNYLRFYPDSSVVWTTDFNHQGSGISFDPERMSLGEHDRDPYTPRGIVHTENGCVTFELFGRGRSFGNEGDFFARYEGRFENGRLWLSCDSPHSYAAHGKLPYRFHPFNPEVFR
jgi:hypothetical protein